MTKQKRSKSKTRTPDEEQPLAPDEASDVSLTKAKFDELLKQAVEESTVDSKSRRRRRKQDQDGETVLDKLRKGEGLRKDEDQTLLANTYDPDDVKGEKSNKRRQKEKEKNDEKENDKGITNLAYEDETLSPGRKKRTKKGQTIEKGSTIEDLAPPPVLKKTTKSEKKINREPVPEPEPGTEDAFSPATGDELAEDKTGKKKRKKKKTKKTDDESEQVLSEDASKDDMERSDDTQLDDTVTETKVMKKKKKKKKQKGDTETSEVEAAAVASEEVAESPRAVEDEGRVIGVIIHRTDKLKTDFYISHPLVRVHIIDLDTGTNLKKQHMDRAVTSYYERDNENVDFILPILTFPFDFKQNKSVLPVWEETLVFNENYNFIIQNTPNCMIFFELLDFVSINTARVKYNHHKQEGGWHRIAWAFLKVVGKTGTPNTDRKVRLQLYQPPVRFRPKAGQVEVYQWWKSGQRDAYPSTLYVTVKGLILPPSLNPAPRSLFATQAEKGITSYDDMQRTLELGQSKRRESVRAHNPSLWSRLPGQVCKIPNTLHFTLPVSRKGCFVISFSPDGRSLACGCHDRDGYPIIIYNIPEGTMKGQMLGHYGIIYDLHWSRDSKLLLSASSDGTARVWDGKNVSQSPVKLLPHPAYVYTASFHIRVQKVVVTGSYDRIIRIWSLHGSDVHAELVQELEGHRGYINTLCFDDDGSILFSGDSQGKIRMWNAYCTDQPSKKGILKDWTKNDEINEAEMDGTPINCIRLHPNGRRLLVHCRDNVIRMVDIRIKAIMQRYHGALNFREQVRSSISPCGTFIISGSEDSTAYVWNAEAGDRVASYKELGYKSAVTDVDFHPHEHMVAFCSYGENHPVLVYKYDHLVAQRDAGLETPLTMVSPRLATGRPGSPELLPEAAKMTAGDKLESVRLPGDGMEINTMARLEKVQRKLEAVTGTFQSSQFIDHPLGIPRTMSPTMGNTMDNTYGSTFDASAWYNQWSDTDAMSNLPPSMFSPHAGKTSLQATMTQQQQLSAEAEYRRGRTSGSTWRPGFSALGTQGTLQRPGSPPFGGRGATISGNTLQGKPQFSFQTPQGAQSKQEKSALYRSQYGAGARVDPTTNKVVALYDYQAQRSDELNLIRGDIVTILYKDNENWWMGELANGAQGFFPANYVTGQSDEKKGRADSDAELLDEFKGGKEKDKDLDDELEEEFHLKERMAAIISRTGELKIFSASATESDMDGTTPKKTRKKKKAAPAADTSISINDETSMATSMKKSSVRRKKKKATIQEESEA